MLNWIWIFMILLSSAYAMFTGRADAVGEAFFSGAEGCIEFCLKTGAFMILWQGILAVADKGRLTERVSELIAPLISFLFGGVKRASKAQRLISANITANALGLSNAATPMGIKAMQELSKSASGGEASDDMCLFAVINSASLQLIPSTLIAMRTSYAAASPADIAVPIWIVSFATVCFAISLCRLFALRENRL